MTPCVLNETSLWWFNRTQRIVAAPDKYVTIAKNAQFFLLNLLHVALEHGLILVDTKYEFGKDSDGSILLIDEVHTPDSSRYWIAAHSHEERFQNGLEPQNELLRLWFKDHCDPYKDEVLPDAPEELVCELAWRNQ
ncbi:phosphoribosylaminoimidazole-succinocarboxamide synthase, chloroplastic isoform X2 [Manihot esculenta]|uniref:phosphoribosylaminoimidazolesuccinocarboxamide synthase n=1 Tax=Manihot esculenta TaxID=3983 RepID=A0A2C9WED6_MANES|nr:phosphoribosylaminoimidazole-succinocarboxamide synthase, chloroplastic isoform X2 [Manihot esculenta]